MAYVALSRSEELNDVYIKGILDRDGIHASPEALEECYRLQNIFDQNMSKMNERAEKYLQISYLNVRSLRGFHREDVKKDNFIMSADVFSLGETHLEKGEEVQFDGYAGFFASHGKGKGVSAFSKTECILFNSIASENYSAIQLRFPKFDAIFLYLSSGCNKDKVLGILDEWMEIGKATVIMGDVNIDYCKDDKFIKSLENAGFQQLIQSPTRVSGSVIDHIYINEELSSLNVSTQMEGAYYSDHDIVTLYIEK